MARQSPTSFISAAWPASIQSKKPQAGCGSAAWSLTTGWRPRPWCDFALAALAANARLEFLGLDGRTRSVIAGTLGAASDEGLLTTITLPSGASCRLVFDRSLRPIVTLALGFDLDGDRIAGGRVAIGCAYAAPLVTALPLGPLMPHRLAAIAQRVAQATLSQLPEPVGDPHATAAYRRRMIAVLLRRNLSALG